MTITQIEKIPEEIVTEIIAYSGEKTALSVCSRWKRVTEKPEVYRRILQLINEHVRLHPLKAQIEELIPHATHFRDEEIPKEVVAIRAHLLKILTSLEALGDTSAMKLTALKSSIGLDRVKRELLRMEWEGLHTFSNALSDTQILTDLVSLSLEERVDLAKKRLLEQPKNGMRNIAIDFSAKQIFLISPEVLNHFPIISLKLNHSNIQQIPKYVCKMNQLKYLFLQGNPITSLPPEFVLLDKLLALHIHDTGLSSKVAEIQTLQKQNNLQIVRA